MQNRNFMYKLLPSMNVLKRIGIACLLLLSTNAALAQIAGWNTTLIAGTTLTFAPTTIDPHLDTPSLTLTRGSGAAAASLSHGFSSSGFPVGGTEAEAITSNRYLQTKLNAKTGYKVSLTSLDAKLRRTGTGPNAYIWRYSTDGSTFHDIGSVVSFTTSGTTGDVQATIDLSGITALQNVLSTTTIYLRVYVWGASNTAGTFAIGTTTTSNDLSITGSVVSAVGVAPAITGNPSNVMGCTGINANFTATATGSPAPTYQWQRSTTGTGGTFVNITTGMDGGVYGTSFTNDTLTVTAPPVSMSGYAYQMVATNTSGSATSTAATLTVNTTPAVLPISGAGNICIGSPIALSETTTGGTWSSSNTSIATVDATGHVTGVSPGTATILYSVTSGSCTGLALYPETVAQTPTAISITPSAAIMCPSSPAQLLTVSGGTANVPTTVSSGSISATFSTGVAATPSLSVSIPTDAVVTGASVTFNATQASGGWDADNIINLKAPNGNILNLVDAKGGTGSTGGFVNTTISSTGSTVIPATGAPYTGTYIADAVNGVGSTGLVSNVTSWAGLTGTPNGTWQLLGDYTFTSGTTTFTSWTLTLNYTYHVPITWAATTGLFTDSAATIAYTGTPADTIYALPGATTTYTAAATYLTCASNADVTVTFNTVLTVPQINGATQLCAGTTTVLSDSTSGGKWSSSDTTIAKVDSMTGLVTGINGGVASITYTYNTGACSGSAFILDTVNSLPVIATISGGSNVCIGTPLSLTDASIGGAWTTSNTAVATVDASGNVTGVAPGSVNITYSISDGTCSNSATAAENVAYTPTALTVTPTTLTMCAGSAPQLLTAAGGNIASSVTVSSGTISLSVASPSAVVVNPVAVSGIPAGATITGASVQLNFSSTFLNDYVFNLKAPNGNILNLVNLEGPHGAGNYTNTIISSLSGAAISGGTTPFTSTYAADEASGAGPAGNISNVTSWSGLYGIPNGSWSIIADNSSTFTNSPTTLTSWSITINYTYNFPVTWSSTTGLFTDSAGSIPYTGTITDSVYAMPSGDVIYTATATNGACSSSNTANITVNPLPTVTLDAASVPACIGSSASFTYSATTSSPTTYSIVWGPAAITDGFTNIIGASFTGGGISAAIPGSATTTTYTGNLTVSNATCTSITYPVSVVVNTPPAVSVTSAGTACTGFATTIHLTGGAADTIIYSIDGTTQPAIVLDGTGNYDIATAPLTASTTYEILTVNNGICTATVDTSVTITPTLPGTWTGATSNDWSVSTNWTCGVIPDATVSVTIHAGTPNPPEITSGSFDVNGLSIDSGVTFTIDGSSTLNVNGNLVNNNGTISGTGTIALTSSTPQTISGNGTVNNMSLNNSTSTTITSGSVHITGTLSFATGSGAFNTGDSLILISTATATGKIGPLDVTSSVNGNVTCQRYIQGGKRAFRFFGHPFDAAIQLTQLEDDIDVTGDGGALNGFTPTYTNNPSAFWYNTYTGNGSAIYDSTGWTSYTGITDSWNRYKGIYILIRGQKYEGIWVCDTCYTPSPVTISLTGHINQQSLDIPLEMGDTSNYNVLCNPYPSPIDIGTVINNAKTAGQVSGSLYWVWNPYDAVQGTYVPMVIGTPYNIEGLASFEVSAVFDGATLHFDENNKTNTGDSSLLRTTSASVQYVMLHLFDTTGKEWDRTYVSFNELAANSADAYDGKKVHNTNLDLYSITADNKDLSFDARPFVNGSVIPLGITTNKPQTFTIKVDAFSVPAGGRLYLHDKYTGIYNELLLGSTYTFTIGSDTLSQGNNRLELAMGSDVTTAVNTINNGIKVSVTPNPAKDDALVTYTFTTSDKKELRLTDVSGTVITKMNLGTQQQGSVRIPLTGLAAGMYLIEVSNGNKTEVQRLIKQ